LAVSFGAVPQTAIIPEAELTALTELTGLLNRAEPRVRRRFLALVDAADALDDLDDVAAMLERGDVTAALARAEEIGPGLSAALESAYTAAGVSSAAVLRSQTDTLLEFNTLNARAQASLAGNRLRLVRQFSAGQREATMEFLDDALRRGLAPVEQARALKGSIGLTRRQAASVTNYRRLLESGSSEALTRQLRDRRFDGTLRGAISGDRTLTTAQIDRMTERYRERMVQFRARTIARTETVRAIHEGDKELWDQAVEAGVVEPADIENVWHTASDERVRSSHRAMDGQVRSIGEAFRSGAGNELRFPGDPNAPASDTVNCRCVVARELKRQRRAA
jgi:hypothetical protein